MSFRTKEISYSELIPVGGITTPKKLSKIFLPYYLKYGLGIESTLMTEGGVQLYKINGIKDFVRENNQIKYLGNQTWKMIHKFKNLNFLMIAKPGVEKTVLQKEILEEKILFKKQQIQKETKNMKGKD